MTQQEWNDIICALEIAAEQYGKDYHVAKESGQESVAAQFQDQVIRAETLIQKIGDFI